MQKTASNILKYTLSFALAAVLLYLAFRGVDWKAFASGLKGALWGYVGLSMLCGLMAFYLRGVRWKWLLNPLDKGISSWRCFGAVNIGNLANMVVQYSGEFIRCGIVSRKNATYDKVLGTVVLERAWDLVSIVVIIVAIVITEGSRFASFFSDNVWKPLYGRISGGAWIIAALLAVLLVAFIAGVILLRDKGGIFGKTYNAMRGVVQGFLTCLHMDHKVAFLLITAAIWVMYWLQIVCAVHAIPHVLLGGAVTALPGLADAMFLMIVGSIASCVPVPGGFGAYHYLIALALSSLYGVPWQSGIIFATLAHESQAVTMILSGVVSYFAVVFKKK